MERYSVATNTFLQASQAAKNLHTLNAVGIARDEPVCSVRHHVMNERYLLFMTGLSLFVHLNDIAVLVTGRWQQVDYLFVKSMTSWSLNLVLLGVKRHNSLSISISIIIKQQVNPFTHACFRDGNFIKFLYKVNFHQVMEFS